jgi:hypothetical protein
MRAQSEKGAGPPSPRPARPASAQARRPPAQPPAQNHGTEREDATAGGRLAPKQAPAATGGLTPPRQAGAGVRE